MTPTLAFYNSKAHEMSAMYECVGDTRSLDRFIAAIPRGCRVLELGCGSGRDAARLVASGFDARGIDGSEEMLARAQELHPELTGRLSRVELPGALPAATASLDAVMAWAVIMHLREDQLPAVFAEVARIVRPGGFFAYSVNTERAGLGPDQTDVAGRRFTCLPAAQWAQLHSAAGFTTIWSHESDDVVGRPGIRWATFLTTRG